MSKESLSTQNRYYTVVWDLSAVTGGFEDGLVQGERRVLTALKKWKELNLHEYSDDSGGFFYLLESELDSWLASRSKPARARKGKP